MGKSKINKKYVLISGLCLRDNNRGTAALGYGAFSFLGQQGLLPENTPILQIKSKGLPFRRNKSCQDKIEVVKIGGTDWSIKTKYVSTLEWRLLFHLGAVLPFGKLKKISKEVRYVAAINGGDGFSDIYGEKSFLRRLGETRFAMATSLPLIILPQTLGPFKEGASRSLAFKILKYAQKVFVRDNRYVEELESAGINYELTNDLSYYMQPEPWDIELKRENSIGINISGLAYYNNFRTLAGQFTCYSDLIENIVSLFQSKNKTIYLIPHSYNFEMPEQNNDDLQASREFYEKLNNKRNVVLIDNNLTSPQVKYVISRMSFFVGTRMHANFAAIFTNVPLFGLAYSYKFEGAFENNNIYNRTANIVNISKTDIKTIIDNIEHAYLEDVINNVLEG